MCVYVSAYYISIYNIFPVFSSSMDLLSIYTEYLFEIFFIYTVKIQFGYHRAMDIHLRGFIDTYGIAVLTEVELLIDKD